MVYSVEERRDIYETFIECQGNMSRAKREYERKHPLGAIPNKVCVCDMPLIKAGKSDKDKSNKEIVTMDDVKKEAKTIIERILGDVSKTSATKQIILGATSGWITGFLAMRVGKTAALALGGGILLLQVANEKGYIKVNWDKLDNKLDKVADRLEEKITGEGPTWMDKAERFVDRKLNKAEGRLKKGQNKAKKWYSGLTGDNCQLQEVHIFLMAFVAGIAIGMATS